MTMLRGAEPLVLAVLRTISTSHGETIFAAALDHLDAELPL
jgi:hypothetical protein